MSSGGKRPTDEQINLWIRNLRTERDEARSEVERLREALSWALDVLEISLKRLDELEPEPYPEGHHALRGAGLAKARAALADTEEES